MSWKPDGYTSASPYLIVRDAEATLRFLEHAFAATRLRIHARESGTGIKHAEARLDDTVIMLGEMPETVAAHVHVYVADADAVFAKAVEAGGQIIQEMSRSGDGDYRGGIADPNGIVWWISTQED
ncbi:glyoxalase/bleomycin resistance/extradiol dioxygenase family protein [Roseibium sp. MMSF_3544]|uniref:VOC family protein n=1 Tax=unclassified Roseibium TaxID=2629323 RepID=UPI00273FA7C2|nr:VOC family protein [Roseibium sp. MMSF_3544]